MNRSTHVLRTALAVAGLFAITASPTNASEPADNSREPAATTQVTFLAPDCDGCKISLIHATWDDTEDVWESRQGTVLDGKVTFRVPQQMTHGMSAAIRTPWEGGTGYVTHVAFKYAGQATGDRVTIGEARHAGKASACWAGTTADSATIKLATRHVTVPGYDGEHTPAALVYSTVTQDALVPMRKTFHGIVGSQDVNFCGPR